MNINYTALCIDNAIEITWICDELVKSGKIPDKYSSSFDADFIKETIIDIAINFEKEYRNADWNELAYLDCIQEYAEPRLIKVLGSN